MASLPDDYWAYDETTQTLSGRRSRTVFSLAQKLEVRLNEAKPVTGGLLFGLAESLAPARPAARSKAKPGKTPKHKPKHKAGESGRAGPEAPASTAKKRKRHR